MNHPENHDRRLHMIMNIFMIFLILTSITLTVLESSEAFMTPGKKQIFLAIHLSILIVFFAEFLYRLWRAPLRSPELSPLRARMHFLIQPFTIIDIIVIVPLFIMIWTRDLHDADGVVLRILRFTSMLNVFRFYQSSRVIRLIHDIGHEVWHELLIVFILSLQCIIISGVLFYAAENGTNPDVKNIFDGIWWSVVTLTTIGY